MPQAGAEPREGGGGGYAATPLQFSDLKESPRNSILLTAKKLNHSCQSPWPPQECCKALSCCSQTGTHTQVPGLPPSLAAERCRKPPAGLYTVPLPGWATAPLYSCSSSLLPEYNAAVLLEPQLAFCTMGTSRLLSGASKAQQPGLCSTNRGARVGEIRDALGCGAGGPAPWGGAMEGLAHRTSSGGSMGWHGFTLLSLLSLAECLAPSGYHLIWCR